MSENVYQQLRSQLAYLKLSAVAERLAGALEEAEAEKPGYTRFLYDLLAVEVAADRERRLERRLRFAKLPEHKTLEQFDWDAQPSIDRRLVEELATLRFVEEKSNVLLIGPPGVGKTMLATALGLKAVHAGYRVYYTTAADLVARTTRAAVEGRWQTTMRFWNGPAVLVIDELGYLPLVGEAGSHLFQVVSRRYQHGSVVLTTNRGIASWGEIFEDTTVAAAILDRLLHKATVIQIQGESYRMRGPPRAPGPAQARARHRPRDQVMRPHSCAAPAPALPSGSGPAVPAPARELAGKLSALFTQDVSIVERLNDAQRRLMNANERLWSELAPDAFGVLYDSADAATIGTSEVAALMRDDRPDSDAMLAALQNVRWTIHRAFCRYQFACEERRQLAVDVGEVSQQLTDALRAAGWSAQEAQQANVHELARGAA